MSSRIEYIIIKLSNNETLVYMAAEAWGSRPQVLTCEDNIQVFPTQNFRK